MEAEPSPGEPPQEATTTTKDGASRIRYVNYESEAQMPDIMKIIQKDLSEPYSVYTYRYFINQWSHLCFLAYDGSECIGAIVCKIDLRDKTDIFGTQTMTLERQKRLPMHQMAYRGYIAMLVVEKEYRKMKIGSKLVRLAIQAMKENGADEIVLETEVTNKPALKLYENLGFLRDKRLFRYYLNGLDALRLKLWMA